MSISGASPYLHDWEESLWQEKQCDPFGLWYKTNFLRPGSMLNSAVQKHPLPVAYASAFSQAAPRAVDHVGCKNVFVEVFIMAEPWGRLGEQGRIWQFLAMAKQPSGCVWPQPCCTTHGTSVLLLPAELVLGRHSHSWMVLLARNFPSSFKELVCIGISGINCVITSSWLICNLWPYDGQPDDASPRSFLGIVLLFFLSM